MLEGLGAHITIKPAIEFEAVILAAEERGLVDDVDDVVVSSVHAVKALKDLAPSMGRFSVFAVGEQTAKAARAAGWKVAVVSESGGMFDLVKRLESRNLGGHAVLWPRSNLADRKALEPLERAGARVLSFVAYKVTNPLRRHELNLAENTAVIFASPSAVCHLEAVLDETALAHDKARVSALAIGRTTAKELKQRGWQLIHVAARPSNEGLLAVALEHLTRRKR